MTGRTAQPIVLDGGLSHQLDLQGCAFGGRLWTARLLKEDPEQITSAHLAFLRAGAQCLISSSYQATPQGFSEEGYSKANIAECLKRSVQLAQVAREIHQSEQEQPVEQAVVASSIGPYGAYLANGSEYRGDYGVSNAVLDDFHRQRFEYLTHHKPDFFACETIPRIQEALVLAQILEEGSIPGWISFTCKNGQEVVDGTPLLECYQMLAEYKNVVALGINCTAPEYIVPLLDTLSNHRTKELGLAIYPNAGAKYDIKSQKWSARNSIPEFFTGLPNWLGYQPDFIGGCCGIGPREIAAVRHEVDRHRFA